MVDFTQLGTYFHPYGFILGLSLLVGTWLVQKKATQIGIKADKLEAMYIWVVAGGVVGARLWHVITDWPLYQSNLQGMLYIWQGGLSILGAILGGSLAAAMWLAYRRRFSPDQLTLKQILDLSVFGLPVAQAIGRLGNYVNQELYGLPTTLPWAVTIDQFHRLPNYIAFDTYHPLFAYEMIAMIIFGMASWRLVAQHDLTERWRLHIGSGRWFAIYCVYYSAIRFGLDFLRMEKTVIAGTNLGINQVILVGVAISALAYLRQSWSIEQKYYV